MICGWSVDNMWLICRWSVDDLSMTRRWYVDDPWIICGWSTHDLYMICRWSVGNAWMICGWSVGAAEPYFLLLVFFACFPLDAPGILLSRIQHVHVYISFATSKIQNKCLFRRACCLRRNAPRSILLVMVILLLPGILAPFATDTRVRMLLILPVRVADWFYVSVS